MPTDYTPQFDDLSDYGRNGRRLPQRGFGGGTSFDDLVEKRARQKAADAIAQQGSDFARGLVDDGLAGDPGSGYGTQPAASRKKILTPAEAALKATQAEITAAAAQKARTTEAASYHKKNLKSFDDGPEGLELAQLQAATAKDTQLSQDKVGTIMGAITPGVSAGDPTDEAKAAQARLSVGRERQDALEQKRARLEQMANDAAGLSAKARADYNRMNDDRLGLTNEGIARAAGPIDVQRLKDGLQPVERPELSPPDDSSYNPDDWVSRRVKKVNEERAAAGRSDFIDPATMAGYNKDSVKRKAGGVIDVNPDAVAQAAVKNSDLTGIAPDSPLSQSLELGRLKASGVTHVGSKPIDEVIAKYGGEDNIDSARLVQTYSKVKNRLAEIDQMMPGMTDKAKAPLADERSVLTGVLAEKEKDIRDRGLWDEVRDPTLMEVLGDDVKRAAKSAVASVGESESYGHRLANSAAEAFDNLIAKAGDAFGMDTTKLRAEQAALRKQVLTKNLANSKGIEDGANAYSTDARRNDAIDAQAAEMAGGLAPSIALSPTGVPVMTSQLAMQMGESQRKNAIAAGDPTDVADAKGKLAAAAAAMFGLIPGAKVSPGASALQKALFHGVIGAGVGAGQDVAMQVAIDDNVDWSRALKSGAFGAFVGGALELPGAVESTIRANNSLIKEARAFGFPDASRPENIGNGWVLRQARANGFEGRTIGDLVDWVNQHNSRVDDFVAKRKAAGGDESNPGKPGDRPALTDGKQSDGGGEVPASGVTPGTDGPPPSSRSGREAIDEEPSAPAEIQADDELAAELGQKRENKPLGEKPKSAVPAPAEFLGVQGDGPKAFESYRLTEDVPALGLEKGASVSRARLEAAGFTVPEQNFQPPAAEGDKTRADTTPAPGPAAEPVSDAAGRVASDIISGRKPDPYKMSVRDLRAELVEHGVTEVTAGGDGAARRPRPLAEANHNDLSLAVRAARLDKEISAGQTTPADLKGPKINKEWTEFAKDSGTLGIPRAEMPQVKAEHRGALTNFLKARGIPSTEQEVLPGSLKPTQAEYSPGKVEKAREFTGGDRAILVSNDGYVVDGHHQWMAKLHDSPDQPMRVIRLGANIREVLGQMKEFPSVETAGGASQADRTPQQKAAAIYKGLLEHHAGETNKIWREQMQELSTNPERFHTVSEVENPKGLKIGDKVMQPDTRVPEFNTGPTPGVVVGVEKSNLPGKGGYSVHVQSTESGKYSSHHGINEIVRQGEAPPVATPAPAAPNTPANFVRGVAAASNLKAGSKQHKFLVDFARRLHAAAPEAFTAMKLRVLNQAEWAADPRTSSETPDSRAAYNPETNTLTINSDKADPESIVSTIVHEAGHFAEKYYLGEDFTQKEWASLKNIERAQAWQQYLGKPFDTSAEGGFPSPDKLLNNRHARAEWVAMQFARVVRGETAGMSAKLKAKLEKFLRAVRELVNKWIGDAKLTTEALDKKILEMLGYKEGAPSLESGKTEIKKPAPAEKRTVSKELGKLGDELFGTPDDPKQAGLFDGGETGGDTTFNLSGGEATDHTGVVDRQDAARQAKKKAEADQGTLFGSPVDRGDILPAHEADELEAAKATARTLREAVRVASGGDAAVSAGQPGRVPSLAEQEDSLSKWASDNGFSLEAKPFADEWKRQGGMGGAESQVYFDEASQRYVKRTALGFSHDWVGYFRRILAHNRLFPDTAYIFHGFTPMDDTVPDTPFARRGGMQAVVSQPFVKGRIAEDAEVRSALTARGFKEDTGVDGQFEDSRFILDDITHGSPNALVDEQGKVRFIDPQVYPKPGVLLGTPADVFNQRFKPDQVEQANRFVAMLVREHPEIRSRATLADFLANNFPKARPFSDTIFRLMGGFTELDESGSFAEAYSAGEKGTSSTAPRPPSNARTELAPTEASQGPGEVKGAKTAPKGKPKGQRISIGQTASGNPDILNDIEDLGGVQSKYSAKSPGGEFDDFSKSFTGPARLLLRRTGGLAPDEIAQSLHDEGRLPDGMVTTLTDAIAKAVAARANERKAVGREQYAQRFERAFLGNEHPRTWLRAGKPISVDDLKEGETFEVEGEKFTVKSVDEHGNVTIQDGITRVVPPGTLVYPDKGKVKRHKKADYFDGIPLEDKPNEPSPGTNLERDSETPAGERSGAADLPTGRGEPRAGDGSVAGAGAKQQGGAGDDSGDAAVRREGRDSPLPERQPGTIGPTPSPHGGEQSAGSGGAGAEGILHDAGADTAVDSVASNRPSGDVVAESRDLDLERRVESQRAAESKPVVLGDLKNIAETLPVLLPEQHDDVLKSERRFAETPTEDDPRRGIMFTNGTGTGKTFTGLGIIKRLVKQGKNNILVVVPTFKKAIDWQKDGSLLGLQSNILESVKERGKGITITTYANFRQNEALAKRDFDAVVYDESHKLVQNEEGSATAAVDVHRHITNHPDILRSKAEERVVGKRPIYPPGAENVNEREAYYAAEDAWRKKRDAKLAEIAMEEKRLGGLTKAVFLSATPFAYHKTLSYADGYLFNSPKSEGGGAYNTAKGFDQFLVSNFGYRMRYNKLTVPETGVDIDLMEREFADRLMKAGAVSGRMIDVPYDYSREFVLVDPGLGAALDKGIGVLYGYQDEKTNDWQHLPRIAGQRFKYHYVQQLMEAIKVAQSLDRIRQHLALGRKIILFHNYVNALPTHPFRNLEEHLGATAKEDDPSAIRDAEKEIKEFYARYPDLVKTDFGKLANPLALLKEEFGDKVVFFNGTVSDKKKLAAVDEFNRDGSGVDLLVAQGESMKEGVSAHDTTGKHQRVVMNVGLPIKPTDAIQEEGRAYRVGVKSNAINEYVVIHTNTEKYAFGSKINLRVRTAENLALGSMARALQDAFKQGYVNPIEAAPGPNQGKGGKEGDRRANVATPFDRAKSFYFGRQKKTSRNKSAEGIDYYATPEPVGYKMTEWLLPQANERLLEPSAGHGAIARFFPNFTVNHYVEPSVDLANELRIKVESGATDMGRFEDYNVVNKFDGIAMNPPFGTGGKTAIDHLAKAASHLKDGGRIVALIPEGPAADAKFAKWYEGADKEFIKVAEFGLPQVTFERAGTAVKTRIVVIDRIGDQNARSEARVQPRRDINAESIDELFSQIQDMEVPPRTRPKVEPPAVADILQGGRGAVLPKAGTAVGDFSSEEFKHTKTQAPIFVAKPTRHLGDDFHRAKQVAVAHGGYYSSFKGAGAIPGFHFKTTEARDAFLDHMRGGQTFGTPAEREEPTAGLNPPKNGEVPGQPGFRYRSHPDSLIEAGLETARQIYKTRNNQADDGTAKAIIKQVGESVAAEMSMDPKAELPGAVKTAIAVNLQRTFNDRRFDTKLSPEDRRAAKKMSDRLAQVKGEEFTNMGQALQFLSRLNDYSPDGVLMAASRNAKQRQEKIIGEAGKKAVDDVADAMQAENAKAIDEATADMQNALRAVKVGKSIWQRYKDAAGRRWMNRIDAALNGAPEQPPMMEFANRLMREVQARIDAALPPGAPKPQRAPTDIIREAVENRDKYKEAWDAARDELAGKYADQPDVLAKLDDAMLGLLDRPYSEGTLDRAIKEAHKEMGQTVRDLARMHYRQADALGQSLADKIVQRAGLKPDDAARLANLVKLRVSKLTLEAKKKALAKLAEGKTGGARRVFGPADKIIELSNLGALTSEEYFDAVAKALGLPELDEKQAAKLRDLAEKAQSTSEGFQRDRVLTDLLSELQKAKGIGKVDIATSVYYAHILSGYTTQMVNAISTAMNTAADVGVMVAQHPTTAMQAARGIRDGAKTGFVQALSILDTGYAHRTFDEKLPEVSPLLESLSKDTDRNVALRNYAKVLRYVSRAMKAMDSVFFQSASEAHQRVAAARLAAEFDSGKLNWQQRASKVRDLLSMSPAEFEAARQQAKAEGLTGLDYQLRVGEIIRQKRDAGMVQAGVDFGREATFNGEPRGYLGVIAKSIRQASDKFQLLKLFVPFTNIVSNVANASLNYSPVGVARAVRGYGGEAAPQAEERNALLIKGIAGSLGLLYLLSYGMGDDEKKPWITGTGPTDATARNELRKTGWKPHTIKIGNSFVSYLETPLAIPLAIVGNYIDGVKYNGLDHKDAGGRLLKALSSVPETIVSMSFLRGLADLMDAARGRKDWGEIASDVVAGATVPNFVRQVDRTFDPTIYDTKGVKGALLGQVPGVRESFQPKLDVVGQPITSSPLERFGRAATNDELWDTLAAKQAWIPEAGKSSKIGKQTMTPEQYRVYVQQSGPAIETRLRAALPRLKLMTPEQASDFVDKVTREERAKVKPRLRAVPSFDLN